MVDEFTRECLCILVGRKLGSAEVIDVWRTCSWPVARLGSSGLTMGRSSWWWP